ncbi:ELAV-like protein 4 [Trichoplax sp. H2]|nr:ELAV-like protein 4 [Trichoplax sp. H2]|eukprot:RDD37529.1 ELAV-like protein 4 [Trichoplax sp. H2]
MAEKIDQSNLIVNYLPQSMTQDEIQSLFSSCGKVISCKLVRDKNSHHSLGYAFVKYEDVADANKAISSLNGLRLQSKVIKVSYARPSSAAIKNANLYVSGLPLHYTHQDLDNLFGQYGAIITSKVLYDGNGVSRGVGFVRYDKRNEAEAAILALNKTLPNGFQAQLTVKFANTPNQKSQSSENSDYTDIAEAPLQHHQHQSLHQQPPPQQQPPLQQQQQQQAWPPVQSDYNNTYQVSTPVSAPTNTASIDPSMPPPSTSSYSRRQQQSYGGPMRHQSSSVRYSPMAANDSPAVPAQSNSNTLVGQNSNSNNWCIFIYNLPQDAEDSLLYQLFAPYGAINNVKLIRELNSKKCKGYGFVNMVNYEEAYNAILHLNGYDVGENRLLQVSFKNNSKKTSNR